MKKIIKILVISSLLFIISACTTPNQENESKPGFLIKRNISIKLPFEQIEYHWVFTNRKSFLRYTNLTIEVYKDKTFKKKIYTLPIIDQGKLVKNWTDIDRKKHKVKNEIYFGFISKKQYDLSTSNYTKLTFNVKKDITGIGANSKGYLAKGTYVTYGKPTYFDEEKYNAGKDATLYIERDESLSLWKLNITKNEGWISK